MIYLEPEIKIHTDYELFISLSKKILRNTDIIDAGNLELIEHTVQLYQGDFLPDNLYEDWTSAQRINLHELYIQILLKLIEAYFQLGRISQALELCQFCLGIDPTDERIIRMAMELLSSNGQRQKALAIYKDFAKHHIQEYGIEPSIETRKIYERICTM